MSIIPFNRNYKAEKTAETLCEQILGEDNLLNIGTSVQFIMVGFNTEEKHAEECNRIRKILEEILSTPKGCEDFLSSVVDCINTATVIKNEPSPFTCDITPIAMSEFVTTIGKEEYVCTLLFIGQTYFIKHLAKRN